MTSLVHTRHRPFGLLAQRFNDLLSQYPRLQPDDIEEMIVLYGRLSILELAVLTADEMLAAPFDDFTQDYRDRLNKTLKHHLFFAFTVLATFGPVVGLVWMATD